MISDTMRPRVRRVPHVDTPKIPERWMIHQRRDKPAIWIAHPVTPHCQARGEEECKFSSADIQGDALDLIQRVADQVRERRLVFRRRMQSRGRYFS